MGAAAPGESSRSKGSLHAAMPVDRHRSRPPLRRAKQRSRGRAFQPNSDLLDQRRASSAAALAGTPHRESFQCIRAEAAESESANSNSESGARLRGQPKGRSGGAVSDANWREIKEVADREGFEPPIPLQVCRISSAVHSTTLPPVRGRSGRSGVLTTHCIRPAQAFPVRCVHNSVTALKSGAAMLLFLDGSPLRD